MGRYRFVVSMMTTTMITASACLTAEPVAADPIEWPGVVTCEGPFARDSSHNKLLATFGAANVVYEKISGTVLYPHDPARRLEIFWQDRNTRSVTASITIDGKSRWTTGDLRLGDSLEVVEGVNDKPFTLNNFSHRYLPGLVQNWDGGKLERFGKRVRGPCLLGATFAAQASRGQLQKLQGETVLSNDPTLRPFRPTLIEIMVYYEGGG